MKSDAQGGTPCLSGGWVWGRQHLKGCFCGSLRVIYSKNMSATITGEVLAVSGSIRIQSNPTGMKLLYHRKQHLHVSHCS